MNIGWAHDFRVENYAGGAELTNQRIIDHAPEWAEIELVLPHAFPAESDCYIVNNVRHFPWGQWQRLMSKPYILFCHDPAHGRLPWQEGKMPEVFRRAEAVVFLSPYHRDAVMNKYNLELESTFTCPSAIDPTRFYAAEKKSGAFFAGTFREYKGIAETVEWARENGETVDFYGDGPVRPVGEGVGFVGSVPYEQIPDIMARRERLVFFPLWIEAFGRVVAEAALSGCKLEVNGNVGAISWGWETRQEWADGVGKAHERFWSIVGEVWGST